MFVERLNDNVETVKGFCYFGNALNGGSEMAVIARTRIGWITFRECGEVFIEDERESLSDLCEIGNTIRE